MTTINSDSESQDTRDYFVLKPPAKIMSTQKYNSGNDPNQSQNINLTMTM